MPPRKDYEAYRSRQAERRREQTSAGQEIGPLPKVANPRRRKKCARSLRAFCEVYLPARFPIPWSPDHLTAIARLESSVLAGGQFAFAMPRGSGKTTLCEAAALFAVVNGHRRFVVLIGSTEAAAEELLDSLKVELETNDLLLADYPAVCHPVRMLDGESRRCVGQHLGGERTRIGWTQKELVLPTAAKSPASGAVVRVTGITGRIRGMKAATADGASIRPDLVIIDDPQTDESARSPTQNAYREGVLAGAVLGLAGPKKKIAAAMPCTVIAPGDMADRVLDRGRHPEWHGERMKLMYGMPAEQDLWDRYAEIRGADLRAGGAGDAATEFYRANRGAMDAGARPAWPERFNPDELSAVQHAMNRKIANPRAFAAEAQNDPLPDAVEGLVEDLDADQVAKKVNRLPAGAVPPDCTRLTAFADVGGSVMWWCVCGWTEGFAGAVVDYGAWPRQNRSYFAAADARPSLADLFPTHDETARVYAGLKGCVEHVVGRPYRRQQGGELRVELCLVDAGWLPDTVHQFVRQSGFGPALLASKGYAVGPAGRPIAEWARKPGERSGDNWRVTPVTGGGRGRLCVFDPNHWKTFVAQRLLTPEGGAGCLTLFGEGRGEHQLFADHLTAEYRVQTQGRGRTVDEWSVRPERRDNHWWDCLVGCAVAASVAGVTWSAASAAGEAVRPRTPKKKIDVEELYKKARAGA